MLKSRNFTRLKKIVFCLSLVCALQYQSFSQADSSFIHINLSYSDYIKLVLTNNLEYSAEKFNVNIADAKIEAAKVFQNPSLSFQWSGTPDNPSVNGYSLATEISKTFELGQKRKARINLAKSGSLLARASLDDYLRNLRADAALSYMNALKENYLYQVMHNSYQAVKELADADSILFSLGSIKAIDAKQTKIEAGVLYNQLLQSDADRKNAFLSLSSQTSSFHNDTLFFPTGRFNNYTRDFKLNELLATALKNRADLMVAKTNISYNRNYLNLTKKERLADIDFKIGADDSYLNTGILSPVTKEIYSGVAIPLKFSNFNKGEIKIAAFQIKQSELLYQYIETNIRNEVVQAYNQYISLLGQVKNYDQGILEQAKLVLNGKVYSYYRGETSLLEVLNAQRTYNDLQTSYYETLYNCSASLIELERAVGIWDISL